MKKILLIFHCIIVIGCRKEKESLFEGYWRCTHEDELDLEIIFTRNQVFLSDLWIDYDYYHATKIDTSNGSIIEESNTQQIRFGLIEGVWDEANREILLTDRSTGEKYICIIVFQEKDYLVLKDQMGNLFEFRRQKLLPK
jgi:hypothetical protein